MNLFRKLRPVVLWGVLAGAAMALSACNDAGSLSRRSLQPIPPETLALMEEAGVGKNAPTLIRTYKKEAELQIWKMRPDGRYVHVKTYPMCRWSGQLGPKTKEGDRQVPEGFYSITPRQMNPNSAYYLAFNVGYPNAYDRAFGHGGGSIMVHGACSSAGCFSMTDRQIAEIYAIARTSFNAGQRAIQMQSYPFKMTAENLAKHRLDPQIGFWRQLKEGSDHFEVAGREPSVGVCGRRYVFDAAPAGGQSLDAASACPPLKRDPQIEALVAEKAAKDNAKVAELAASGVKAVRLVYRDGGQNPVFYARVAEVSRPEALAPPVEIALEEKTAKKARKLAASSPVVTMAAARAAAERRAEAETASVPQTTASEPSAGVLAASADSIGGWLGLRKAAEPKTARDEGADVSPTVADAMRPTPLPPRRAAAGKKPPAPLGRAPHAARETESTLAVARAPSSTSTR